VRGAHGIGRRGCPCWPQCGRSAQERPHGEHARCWRVIGQASLSRTCVTWASTVSLGHETPGGDRAVRPGPRHQPRTSRSGREPASARPGGACPAVWRRSFGVDDAFPFLSPSLSARSASTTVSRGRNTLVLDGRDPTRSGMILDQAHCIARLDVLDMTRTAGPRVSPDRLARPGPLSVWVRGS